MIKSRKLSNRATMFVAIASVFFLLLMVGCGGGGGGGGSTPPDLEPGGGSDSVTVSGIVYDGTESSPIENAVCDFVDMDGNPLADSEATADEYGNFAITVPPDVEGYIRCYPPDSPKLVLLSFLSTNNVEGGYEIDGEDVTPATTLVANIIHAENAADPQQRKIELLNSIDTDQDFKIVTVAATHLYSRMFQRHRNVIFGGFLNDEDGGGGGGGGGGDGGGAGGSAGDGGDASPIVGARCEFIVGNDIKNGKVLYSAALADFLDDGRVERSDLSLVSADIDSILQGYTPQEIQSAFRAIFPAGIGKPYDDITDENGNYFIPIPPNTPGFIRCIPADRDELVLATYVPERQLSEILLGQDVNPATTLFSVEVAPKLNSADVAAAKDNFLKNIDGINVYIREKQVAGADVVTFSLCAPPPGEVDPPANCVLNIDQQDSETDSNVGMMAFSATSLFNSFYKNGINGDFLSALSDLSRNGVVPETELQASGVPTAQVTELKSSINTHAATVLSTRLNLASQTARVKVTVTDVPGGTGIEGATVDTTSSYACTGCGNQTDASGMITLTFTGVPSDTTDIEIVAGGGLPGYVEVKKTVTVSASSTVDLELAMDNSSPVVKILSPTTSSTYWTGSKYLSISGTASDDVNVAQVTWVNDRGGSGTCVGTARWSTSEVALALGTNQISISALDTAGNTGFTTLTVTYQPVFVPISPIPQPITPIVPLVPTVTITTPTTDAEYTTYINLLKVSGTATDDTGISRITWVSKNGDRVDRGTCLTSTKVGSSELTVGWSASGIPLTLGTNEVIVTAEDKDANTGSRTLTVTLKALSIVPIYPVLPGPIPIVTIKPSVTITSPTTEAEYTTFISTVNIIGTATDDGGVTQVTWTNLNGANGTCVGTSAWSTGDISLALGINEITITAYDGAGNTGTAVLNVTYQLPTILPIFPVTPIIKPIVPIAPG
jgi:hypothetical protein